MLKMCCSRTHTCTRHQFTVFVLVLIIKLFAILVLILVIKFFTGLVLAIKFPRDEVLVLMIAYSYPTLEIREVPFF